MGGFWANLLIAVAVVAVIALGSMAWMFWRLNADTVTPVAEANPAGTAGTALIVYQPGLSDFQAKVTTAFKEGLVEAGWHVFSTTASEKAPSDLAPYDVIVLGSPVYGGAPGKPLSRYIERVADFGGKPVVILMTAAGDAVPAIAVTSEAVAKSKGRPVRSVGLTTSRPNDEANEFTGSNVDRAIQIARRAGRTLEFPTD